MQIEAAVKGRTERGFEDDILRIEAMVPGLGGLSLDDDGVVVAFLKDTLSAPAARAAINAMSLDLVDLEPEIRMKFSSVIRFRQGRFAFSELLEWKIFLQQQLRWMEAFQAIDANEGTNQLTVFLTRGRGVAAAQQVIRDLKLPDSLIQIRVRPLPVSFATLQDYFRPIRGGYQITDAANEECTAASGSLVADDSSLMPGFLTAAHCVPGTLGIGSLGEYFYQPHTTPLSNRVARVAVNPPWDRTDVGCQGHTLCTRADVAFLRLLNDSAPPATAARTTTVGLNNNPGSIVISSSNPWLQAGKGSAAMNVAVDKVGRTTGWTRGTVTNTCVDQPIGSPNGTFVLLCAVQVSNAAAGAGDSGAPVFRPTIGNLMTYYGVLSAGLCDGGCVYFYSSIPQIQAHLGLNLWP